MKQSLPFLCRWRVISSWEWQGGFAALFQIEEVSEVLKEATLKVPENKYFTKGGKEGVHTEHMGYILAELQYMQRTYPNMQW